MTSVDLNDLVAWFVRVVAADVPSSLFGSNTVDVVVQGGSITGDDGLVAYATTHPMATDADGFYQRPAHAAIAAIAYRKPRRAAYLRHLASTCDWEAAGWRLNLDGDEARAYAFVAIADFRSRLRARAVARPI